MDSETVERPSLTEEEITALIADPALISAHEIALEVLDCLDSEIANIQAQIDAAQIESNAKPLSADRQAWIRRASYAAAMRRNERHRVMQRDKELRGTKMLASLPRKDPEAQRIKQERLKMEAETRRDAKKLEVEKQRTLQMQLAHQKRDDAATIALLRGEIVSLQAEIRRPIPAWHGDGVSCVHQLITVFAKRARDLAAELSELKSGRGETVNAEGLNPVQHAGSTPAAPTIIPASAGSADVGKVQDV